MVMVLNVGKNNVKTSGGFPSNLVGGISKFFFTIIGL